MMEKFTIFSIDGANNPLKRIMFMGQFMDAGPAGNLLPLIGSYKGEAEYSFICLSSDFERIVRNSGAVDQQESILRVSECNKQYSTLEYLDFGYAPRTEYLGCMKAVSEAEAKQHDSWSYRIDLDQYFIVVDGNNDTMPEDL